MELQPDGGQQTDSRRAMFAMMAILGMMLLWGYFLAPKPSGEQPQPTVDRAAPTESKRDTQTKTPPKEGSETTQFSEGSQDTRENTNQGTNKESGTAGDDDNKDEETRESEARPEPPHRTIVKRSKRFVAEFSNQDAALARLILLDYYRTPPDKRAALRKLKNDPNADVAVHGFPLLGQTSRPEPISAKSESAPSLVLLDAYKPKSEEKNEKEKSEEKRKEEEEATLPTPSADGVFRPRRFELVDDDERTVAFRTTFLDGALEVTKTFRLPAPEDNLQRHLTVEIQLRNLGQATLELDGYALLGGGGIAVDQGPKSWKLDGPTDKERKTTSRHMAAAVASRNDNGERNWARRYASTLRKKGRNKGTLYEHTSHVLWSAAQSNYFAAVLEPMREKGQGNWVHSGGARRLGKHNLTHDIQAGTITLTPGQAVAHRYRFFAGPKNPEIIEQQYGYVKVRKPGKLDFLVFIMSAILRGAYYLVGNYGVAILILTLLVRGCMHPLSRISQKSMYKMQKLKPKMDEIKEKYKHDKTRQREEVMKFQREHGTGLGGCLPILLQLPIFIGLFTTLRESMELRHAPFVLWIQDLSQPDCLVQDFPVLGVLNILPLISCAIMFLQQRMMPKSSDPQQAQTQKMMGYMMPVMIGWIFYTFPSGLALYFIASTCFGLAESKLIKGHLARKEAEAPTPPPVTPKPGKPRKKSGSGRKRKAF
ncbi:YidC/Oxa1 family insertase periplasmic-domain containing protein [Planctomycetota bacterium]